MSSTSKYVIALAIALALTAAISFTTLRAQSIERIRLELPQPLPLRSRLVLVAYMLFTALVTSALGQVNLLIGAMALGVLACIPLRRVLLGAPGAP